MLKAIRAAKRDPAALADVAGTKWKIACRMGDCDLWHSDMGRVGPECYAGNPTGEGNAAEVYAVKIALAGLGAQSEAAVAGRRKGGRHEIRRQGA